MVVKHFTSSILSNTSSTTSPLQRTICTLVSGRRCTAIRSMLGRHISGVRIVNSLVAAPVASATTSITRDPIRSTKMPLASILTGSTSAEP